MGKARRLAKSATGAQKVLTVNDTAGEDYYGNKDNVLLDVQASKKVSVGSAEPHVARLTARQRKKLVKVVEKKKKKKERAGLIQSLADSQLSADQMVLFQRSAQMGRNKETKRELAKRTELEAQNLPVMVGVQKNVIEVINTDTTDKKSKKRKRASAVTGNGEKTEEAMEKQRRKKARRKAAKEEAKAQKAKEDQEMGRAAPVMSFLAFAEAEQAKRDSDESDSDTDSDSGTESGTGSESETGDESEEEGSKAAEQDDNAEAEDTTVSTLGPIAYKESHLTLTRVKRDANEVVDAATFVSLNRDPEIQAQRLQLPILGEEQRVMETIRETPIVILCGETGSGKTTQVPQFLYEAGFGSGKGDYPGLIGVTEPRRVAAISMSERVGKEMGQPSLSGFQVRYSGDCTEATKLKFMTDGVLLKEIERDFLINKYSAIIIDEAHERTLNTDILIGLLSRIVPLRNKLAQEANEAVYPIRLVIMSATLRVEDFTMNTRIFPTPPPVVEIASRQFPVTIHFNRKTPHENYIQEALKKTSKIHEKLPPGGILVFVTSQAEVTQMVTKLKKKYSRTKQTAPATSTPGGQNATDTKGGAETVEMEMDGGTSAESGKKATKATDTSGELSGESGSEDEDDPNMAIGAISAGPLHVLPLYAMLPQAQQMRVFEQPPEGARLCVIATNVAETSLTIPNIKYVVDTGKVKTKRHETAAAISKFEIEWTSQAAANQRAGRAGRTGPGHTYRIFSSAVYNNYFEKFSDPEVLRLPIEGVLLQMKAMGIDNVINFPFPTPPDHEGLMAAERLLTRLNCLDDKGKITAIGRKVSNFPLAPRFSRMLVTALDLGGQCVPYVIAICAALTVGNVFYASMIENSDDEEENTDEPQRPRRRDSDDEGPSKKQQALLDEQSILRNEAEKSKSANRAKTRKIKQRWIGSNPKSDLLTILKAVGAYEHTYETAYASVHNDQTQTEGKRRKKQKQSDRVLGDKVIAGSTLAFCESNLLNYKSMEEIRKLRQQLSKLVREHVQQNAGGHSKVKKRSKVDYGAPLRPPTGELQKQLWQAILSAYGDHVAKRVVPSSRTTSGTDEGATEGATEGAAAGSASSFWRPCGETCCLFIAYLELH
ncbi:hypothetical protein SARC_06709 [Sphaeroforma arctica JP610]|uniref:RNA helicase n=1 Tax=Sphaeroforma arctica JP610 TaxID=667725 RepID=A0A0L0FWB7_9EUKA|nr:hypothetical protein SARC_06709 [Sphaeroforma arctica JP610]KNC80944.1 hypothetical protein SARC_06709 [Sphaeroforma arctica JP610]|eukprot:XP_014154846.1 hypothetical protein SARC_06709 [Sphaeroforma arctica JP610]